MSLTPEQYIALSTAAYGKYTNTNKNTTLRDMLGKKDQNIISDSDSSTSIELHTSLSDYKTYRLYFYLFRLSCRYLSES